jgi:uncharacterized membrane protein
MKYSPPGGKTGAFFAKLFGDSGEKQIGDDLARFKSLLESAEIPPPGMV